ncbi:DNA endonuclease SmrA [Agaribacter marinus]|uniref:Smr domain-containing protein n=1 Tax=Agaribacter marinus TaxID=1431249 RepID=A0AA37SZH4_9ALTE|nr:DNA endonuclease SmrA [Agaribacter marinus]GLR70811.1 Smr domain-containing protein [Agaribacter marinus]
MKNNAQDLNFFEAMADVKPLQNQNKISVIQRDTPSLAQQLKRESIERRIALDDNGLSIEYVNPIDPLDFIAYKKDGIQEGVFKNLRLGKYQIDSRLVLKHLSFDDARLSIYQTVTECHERGIRAILIDHGIGLNSKPFKGFLKSYVNQWLREMNAVIAFHTALKQHGGLGSVYVLLKKHPNQKLINREMHQKR